MAPRKQSRGGASKSAPKKRVAANGFKLPDPIPAGQILIDVTKNVWVLGKSIGQGGFGEIYLASNDPDRPVRDTDKFVVKVEPHSNGPLFTEMHCYMRIAKPTLIDTWMKEHRLKRFGMPKYLGSGSFEYNNQKFRFMVMERFGSDLQKILEQHNNKFSFKTVYQLGLEIIDVLEYIHDKGYIHADIKASNLLVGYQKGTENQVFLVDYGLACRYAVDGVHKEYKYDGRKAHDGTIEFTSRDAHIGAHSRRGDLEILGYNFTQWLCSRLPWEENLLDTDYVAKHKRYYMDNVDKLMDKCFPDVVPPGLQEYLTYIASLTFDEKPDYEKCRRILRTGLVERGYKDDGKLVFMSATPKPISKKPKSRINKVSTTPNKRGRAVPVVNSDIEEESENEEASDDEDEVVEKRQDVSADMFAESDGDEVMEVIPVSRKRLAPKGRSVKATVTPVRGGRSDSSKGESSTPRSSGSSSTPRSTRVATNPAIKRSKTACSGSPSGSKAKRSKTEEQTFNVSDAASDVVSLSSASSEEFEKENSSRRANTKATTGAARGSRAKALVEPQEDEDEVFDVELPKSFKAKARVGGRTAARPAKRSATNESAALSSESNAQELYPGFDNPTPAMKELIDKRNAKLAATKSKKKNKL